MTAVLALLPAIADCQNIAVLPTQVMLSSRESTQRLILQQQANGEATQQVADGITWSSDKPDIATVDEHGVVRPVAVGTATITAAATGQTATVRVTVTGSTEPFAWSFRNHVEPVLAKAGCNSGACHGALAGKGGFRLSLRGYDPATDRFNIVEQDRGRRVEFADRNETTLYVSATNGDLLAKRHDLWRWFDFFWMLHIMDYDERSDANNTLLRVSSAIGLLFAVTGVWLLFYSFKRRRPA